MPNLSLHFDGRTHIDNCLARLRDVCSVRFAANVSEPDTRDLLTNPEFADVCAVVILEFESDEDRRAFMANSNCYRIYQEFAGRKDSP